MINEPLPFTGLLISSQKAKSQSKPHPGTSHKQPDELIGGSRERSSPCPFYTRPWSLRVKKRHRALLTSQRSTLETVYEPSERAPRRCVAPSALVPGWIPRRGHSPKTPTSSIRWRRRTRRARSRRSPKTWRRRREPSCSGPASRSASSRWFPRRAPVGLLALPPTRLRCCRHRPPSRARASLQGLFTRRGEFPRRVPREFPEAPARTVRSFVRKSRALGSRLPPFLHLLVSPLLRSYETKKEI